MSGPDAWEAGPGATHRHLTALKKDCNLPPSATPAFANIPTSDNGTESKGLCCGPLRGISENLEIPRF